MCNLLDDPPQTAVRSVLRRILTFRQCAIPRGPKPLVLPLLAHDSFQVAVERWISDIIINSKEYMILFHLPHKKCVAGKHRSLRDVIYNNIALAEQWMWDSPSPCNCQVLRLQHPDIHSVDGHIASPLSQFSFSKRLRRLLQYSMDSQLFPIPELVSLPEHHMACCSALAVMYSMLCMRTGKPSFSTNGRNINMLRSLDRSTKMPFLSRIL